MNDRRLRVSNRKNMFEMLFATGMPFGEKDGLDTTLNGLAKLMQDVQAYDEGAAARFSLCSGWKIGWVLGTKPSSMGYGGLLIARKPVPNRTWSNGKPMANEAICTNNFIFESFAKPRQ